MHELYTKAAVVFLRLQLYRHSFSVAFFYGLVDFPDKATPTVKRKPPTSRTLDVKLTGS